MQNYRKGFLISFEGIDKCGKTTQINLLAKKLQDLNLKFELFREPGSTTISEQVRRILLSTEHSTIDALCETLLYSAARAQLVTEKIIPTLKKGAFVLLDRFYHSTIAYQGYGRGIDLELINKINQKVSQGYTPDLTFILDITPEDAIHRRDEVGRDRVERSSLDFFERVRKGYLNLAKEDEHLVVIEGKMDKEKIAQIVWSKVAEKAANLIK